MKLGSLNPQWKSSVLVIPMLAALALTPARGQTVLRTQVYHQVTAFTNQSVNNNGHDIALSGDGRKIAFGIYQAGSNLTYTVNFDGTALTLVNMSRENDVPQTVNISDDGAVVMSQESSSGWEHHALIVNSGGGNGHQAISVNGAYAQFRLSPKGDRVFFVCDRGFDSVPSPGAHEGGLYSVGSDGTGFTNILTVTRLAQFFGVGADAVYPAGTAVYLAVSGDGKWLLYVVQINGVYRLLRVNADGTGIHEIPFAAPGYYYRLDNFGITGDGSKIFYLLALAPCCSSGWELGVMNSDGTGKVVLYRGDAAWAGNTLQMSRDGSKLHSSDMNMLFNTDGSGKRELGGHTDSALLHWGLYQMVMSTNATRFAFLAHPYDSGLLQVGTMEINPTNFGSAPLLYQTAATPPYLLTNGAWSTLLTTRVSPSTNLFEGSVAADVLLNGIHDLSTDDNEPLVDNGSSGDVTAGDGLYSTWRLYAYPWGANSILGPRTLRFKAERADNNSMYHATIVELGPFWVLAQAPSGPPPAIVSITPSNAAPGTQITITGSGFDPIATNNVVLIGNQLAQVISVNLQGTQLVVVVPAGLPPGSVQVTVSSLGQTGTPGGFTVPGPATSRLDIKLVPVTVMASGLDVYGTVGRSYRIEYVTDLHNNSNNWLPLTNLVLPASPYRWIDPGSINQPKRFYRSVLLQ